MYIDRNKNNFVTIYNLSWLLMIIYAVTLVNGLQVIEDDEATHTKTTINNKNPEDNVIQKEPTVSALNPRLDYTNEWRPVGRGDPLKNDPTYDYSPPALERVRYWAESSDKDGNKMKDSEVTVGAGVRKATATATASSTTKTTGKKEISQLRLATNHEQRHRGMQQHQLQQQQQSPSSVYMYKNAKGETPMLQPKYTSIRRSYYAQQMPPTHLMPPPMQTIVPPLQMMKPNAMEYNNRPQQQQQHNMHAPQHGPGMSTHSKPYYSTAATSPWMHHTASVTTSPASHHMQHYKPSPNDAKHQESVHYFSYTRPSNSAESSYSPNAIRPNQDTYKQGMTAQYHKPWLHELLQKEFIKPIKPTMPAATYFMSSTRPLYESVSSDGAGSSGISTTYPPVSFVSTTTTQAPARSSPVVTITTNPSIHRTSSLPPPLRATMTTNAAMVPTTQHYYATAPSSTSTTTPSRLLIPNTSNLAHRPTVAPMRMTTDSMFSHYNQPERPLMGPMYLIIEGHSKVKKYGKNEIDPHQPKIVPIIPKREPVVRIGDPNDKRGTIETFQVKHLHTKTTPPTTTTPTTKTTTTTTTTGKPTLATTTTAKSQINDVQETVEPPTGMQGLLSLLDTSLSNVLKNREDENSEQDNKIYVTTVRTILKPVPTATTEISMNQQAQPQLEARIGNHADTIDSTLDDEESEIPITTEPIPREVRQVYDYDHLPDSRLKDFISDSLEEDAAISTAVDADGWPTYDDVDEYEDESEQLIKRIDRLATSNNNDDTDANDDDETETTEDLEAMELIEDETDSLELSRAKTAISS